jgi:hypothetical protein
VARGLCTFEGFLPRESLLAQLQRVFRFAIVLINRRGDDGASGGGGSFFCAISLHSLKKTNCNAHLRNEEIKINPACGYSRVNFLNSNPFMGIAHRLSSSDAATEPTNFGL